VIQKPIKANQEGSVLLFGIALGIVALLVLTTAINIATLWVTRTKLDSVADATALAASHSINVGQIYENGISQPIKLDENLAHQKAFNYMNQLGITAHLKNFKIIKLSTDQNDVEITVQADAKLPFGYLLPGLTSTVIASAKAAIKTG
jgi:hypothetical protein